MARRLSGIWPLAILLPLVVGVYWLSLAPDIVWDPPTTGTLLASLTSPEFFGLTPSPLYFVIGQIWERVPLRTLAFRGNLVALLLGILSAILIYKISSKVSGGNRFGLFGAISAAFLPLFWPVSLRANFDGLFLLVALFFIYFLLSARHKFGAGVALGLAMATHPAGVILVLPFLIGFLPKEHRWPVLGIGFGLLGVFLGLVPILGIGWFFGLSLGKFYSSLQPLSPFLPALWQNLLAFAELLLKVPWPFFTLALIGALWGIKGESRCSVLTIFLSSLAPLGIYWVSEDPGVFLLPVVVMIVWSASGARVLWDLLATLSNTEIGAAFENRFFVLVFRLKRQVLLLRYVLLGALLVFLTALPASEAFKSFRIFDRHLDTAARDYGEGVIEKLPSRSVILAQKQEFLSTLRYFSALENREGVIVTSTSLVLDPAEHARLVQYHPDLWLPPLISEVSASDKTLAQFVAKNLGTFAIYLTLDQPSRGRGGFYGRWGNYRLISEEPLYRVVSAN